MSDTKQVILPIIGMTCANCVATVERNLGKVDGVENVTVNLSSERASVEYNPSMSELDDFIDRIQRAGYNVATGEADLIITRMRDDNDARRLEKSLRSLEGVQEVNVSYTSERARVRYVPTVISQAEIRQAITSSWLDLHRASISTLYGPRLWSASRKYCPGSMVGLDDVGSSYSSAVLCWVAILCWGLQSFTEFLSKYGRAYCNGLVSSIFLLYGCRFRINPRKCLF